MSYPHFSVEEFHRCTPSCSILDMDTNFMDRLETARAYSLYPFVLTSAFRSVAYEKEHKRSGLSSHCKGCAVDILCNDSHRRLIIIQSLLRAGFRRIGVAPTYIHVDSDSDKPQCIWCYDMSND